MNNTTLLLRRILTEQGSELLSDWIQGQISSMGSRGLIRESELHNQSNEFLKAFRTAIDTGSGEDINGPAWAPVRDQLSDISRTRALAGATPSETAMFIFSLKQPLFTRLRIEAGSDADALAGEIWTTTMILDQLGLLTTESYLRSREDVIIRQQQELLELSTPVVRLWENILALPLIGTLDSARTQVVMESLLQEIVATGASIAIIDITGVPTVDTLVAQHLLKTVAAARLMGADCIISGIRPQIAQTIVHLGVELNEVVTKATLADAFGIALRRLGMTIITRN